MRSVTPVALSALDITNTEATMIAGSLANPARASVGVENARERQSEQRQHRGDVDAHAFADEQRERARQDHEKNDLL